MSTQNLMDSQPVSMELHHEIEQFLYREARMLNDELLRDWLDNIVDENVRYQMVVTEERLQKDRKSLSDRELMIYDENRSAMDFRVRQFETGIQTMLDPKQRLRRLINNIEAYQAEKDDEYLVYSSGMTTRFRRLYENELIVYGRKDILRRTDEGSFKLISRRIELDERVVRNKNLLFFL